MLGEKPSLYAKLSNPVPFQLYAHKPTLLVVLTAVAAALLDAMIQIFCRSKIHNKGTSKLVSTWLLLWQ